MHCQAASATIMVMVEMMQVRVAMLLADLAFSFSTRFSNSLADLCHSHRLSWRDRGLLLFFCFCCSFSLKSLGVPPLPLPPGPDLGATPRLQHCLPHLGDHILVGLRQLLLLRLRHHVLLPHLHLHLLQHLHLTPHRLILTPLHRHLLRAAHHNPGQLLRTAPVAILVLVLVLASEHSCDPLPPLTPSPTLPFSLHISRTPQFLRRRRGWP